MTQKFSMLENTRRKNNQMRSPSLLSGLKIRKAYFESSNPKMLLQNQILIGFMK